jgi:squalene synthase HpnC
VIVAAPAVAAASAALLPRPLRPRPAEVAAAYRECVRIARAHYENFGVGSLLLPRALRRHVAAIYAFARAADDMADEGDLSREERLARLDAWEWALDEAYRGRPTEPVFVALADTAARFAIPITPFRRLLRAFRSDVDFRPFATFDDLRGYCRDSADPVGHLILYLFGYGDAHRQALSDRVCTGLQLANFWQDVSVDAKKGRVYVPLDDLARFGVSEDDLLRGRDDEPVRALLAFEVERARTHLVEGLALADTVVPRPHRGRRLRDVGAAAGAFAHGQGGRAAARPRRARCLGGARGGRACTTRAHGARTPAGERPASARRTAPPGGVRLLPRRDAEELEQLLQRLQAARSGAARRAVRRVRVLPLRRRCRRRRARAQSAGVARSLAW